jgi:endo-1,4-beta-D-glucanase Y
MKTTKITLKQNFLSPILAWVMLLFLNASFSQAAQFPFPTRSGYDFGITATSAQDSAIIQQLFTQWLDTFYIESPQYPSLARVAFDKPEETVSEGIGYGMLILVYMENDLNHTQAKFDRLWNYYQKFANSNGLMHWKIEGFTTVVESHGATDGDLDVALALAMAYRQWGDEKYLTAAQKIITAIRNWELDGMHVFKPGDAWDERKNPSYVSMAAIPIFKKLDNAYAYKWDAALTANWAYLQKSQSTTTGLWPDWTQPDGTQFVASHQYSKFDYDAIRTPWRVAWAYAWHGSAIGYSLNNKLMTWITNEVNDDPAEVVDGYLQNGTAYGKGHTGAFIGAFGCGGMISGTHQDWVQAAFDTMSVARKYDGYYARTLQMLYVLLMSGNMPDYWKDFTLPDSLLPSLQATGYAHWDGNLPTAWFTSEDSIIGGKSYANSLVVTDTLVSVKAHLVASTTIQDDAPFFAGMRAYFSPTLDIVPQLNNTDSVQVVVKATAGAQLRIGLLQETLEWRFPTAIWYKPHTATGGWDTVMIHPLKDSLSNTRPFSTYDNNGYNGIDISVHGTQAATVDIAVQSIRFFEYTPPTQPAQATWYSILTLGKWYAYKDSKGSLVDTARVSFPAGNGTVTAKLQTKSGADYSGIGINYGLEPTGISLQAANRIVVRATISERHVINAEFKQQNLKTSSNYYFKRLMGTGQMQDYAIPFAELQQLWSPKNAAEEQAFNKNAITGIQFANKTAGENTQIIIHEIFINGNAVPSIEHLGTTQPGPSPILQAGHKAVHSLQLQYKYDLLGRIVP